MKRFWLWLLSFLPNIGDYEETTAESVYDPEVRNAVDYYNAEEDFHRRALINTRWLREFYKRRPRPWRTK